MKRPNSYKEQGVSIFFAIVVMSVVLSIGMGISVVFVKNIKILRGVGYSVIARGAADAGAEHIFAVDTSTCLGDIPCLQNEAIAIGIQALSNGASYTIIVESGGSGSCPGTQTYCAESTGEFQGVRRRIELLR